MPYHRQWLKFILGAYCIKGSDQHQSPILDSDLSICWDPTI